MDEFGLIRHYFQRGFNNSLDITGGNDDCAAVVSTQAVQHLSIDTMVAGVHFFEAMNPADIAHRALATAASDLAAAGAKPEWFSLALTLPHVEETWLAAFSQGLKNVAASIDIQLIGGDTTKGPLTITVQVAGTTDGLHNLHRSAAEVGELLVVSGELGSAAGGLAQWSEQNPDALLRAAYTQPRPQVALGQALYGKASSCIDISDGLLADARHIATASSCQLQIDCQQLPINAALVQAFGPEQATLMALTGGDDYQLLFTLKPSQKAWLDTLPQKTTVIGQVISGEGVSLINSQGLTLPKKLGFNHFIS